MTYKAKAYDSLKKMYGKLLWMKIMFINVLFN